MWHTQQGTRDGEGPESLDAEGRWRAVLGREAGHDGAFVYAVRSTGIYCRPSCPARRPRREQVVFFDRPGAAARAGYRPCRRCRPEQEAAGAPRLRLVRDACRAIEDWGEADGAGPPTLAALGARLGVSPCHLQRTFKAVTGITPRQYADAARLDGFKARLQEGASVTAALYDAGYGSSSRLYERAPARLGMTPATYGRGGAGTTIGYTVAACPLGQLLVAATERGVCAVSLGDAAPALEAALAREYPAAALARDDARLGPWVAALLRHLAGEQPGLDLPLDIRATAFRWRVWEALRAIPRGETRSYGALARSLGRPGATRAVAQACAANPVALAIPCHRAVRGDGGLGGYRWGVERKQALLEREREGRG